ncbi:MAG TPA: c-type cytochrome [Rhizobiaceae bacterium]|nr:c-type cytochrome [Rhizobiaceae bacterium]
MIRLNWKHVALVLAVLPFVAILVAWIGFFNVGASSGHWKITNWFLHFAMRSAVRTYALAVDVPGELPRHAIQPAAGHFARGCAICHGAPGEPRSPSVMRMLPQPPDLSAAVGQWTDAQLFRIAKHGIRFTGMPAWPTLDRDDEVWAMVAFLRDLPSLDAQAYRELAYGPGRLIDDARTSRFERALGSCIRCHGQDGLGRSPVTPMLAGQKEAYLLESLRAYQRNDRASGVMTLAVTGVEPEDLPELARYFAGLPQPAIRVKANDSDLAAAGAAIAERGRPSDRIPACLGCHGSGRNPAYPRLDGLDPTYIRTQLQLFRAARRGGTQYSHLMEVAARELDDRDIEALAAYFASRPATVGKTD